MCVAVLISRVLSRGQFHCCYCRLLLHLLCPTPETTVRLQVSERLRTVGRYGVPNPEDYRETCWSAQPGDPRTLSVPMT